MMLFGVTLSKRYTFKQKKIFLSETHQYFQNLDYEISYQNNKSKLKSVTNMVIGELDKANVVVVCAYDTPSSVLLPNYLYYPFNIKKNLAQENINLVLQFVLMGLCFSAIYFLVSPFNTFSSIGKIIVSLLCGILGFIAYKLMQGSANKVNFNRSSASVALIGKLAEELKGNNDIAFVLLDQNINSYEGLKLLKKELKNSRKLILYLDCLAYGTYLVCAHNEKMKETADQLIYHLKPLNIINKTYKPERYEETMLKFSTNMLVLTNGEIINEQLAVKNTRSRKDYQLDIKRLESIEKGLGAFLVEVKKCAISHVQ
ncbi:hypothetical protein bsdtw1_02540 [Clostridium fungisolvens]|uniref:Uncharacterized protein n=2 Tax=Clostridium fungisolvens TaxID=1604897 RepID=A0A6V8SGY5_9CLOT|nr:hypothetical protein bsdtw1_02540 [Clostridium fungisolvens]